MQFAVSHDRVDAAFAADRAPADAPATLTQRTSITVALVAMAVCAVVAKGHLIERSAPPAPQATAQNSVAAPAKIVAPEFCKDQTWPYIDSRCLRRVDNAAAPAAQPRVVTPSSPNAPAAAAPPSPPVSAASTAPAADAPDARAQVIESVFPAPMSGATAESGARDNAVSATGTTSATEARPRHRAQHWGYRSSFFGSRF